MSAVDQFAWSTASAIAAQIRARKVSPVEVMEATISRIEARNPSLNAFVFTDFEGARAAVAKVGELLGDARGRGAA